eukprot:TRINITY_DN23889_c0_g2_i1.p1 TRINITY_DN23889_c0_g2~~TRINITY_DN23889_c0_g2_i1.p1  ORF type:complete len:438 (+),score=49.17 TRINITY_DN23889_c0_g2_i1:41-1354(+)
MSTWSCRLCTYEHCGREANFLTCAVCGSEGNGAEDSHEGYSSLAPAASRDPVVAPARPVAAAEDSWGNWLIRTGRGAFQVQMGGRGLGDLEAIHWSRLARRRLGAMFSETGVPPHVSIVNLSENRLGFDGLQAIIELLSDLKIGVRVFQLHRNELDNRAADVLEQFIKVCPHSIEELHLSHNQLELEGALTLLRAFMSAGAKGSPRYPVRDNCGRWRPVWLRLEFNRFSTMKHELLQPTYEEKFRSLRRSCGYKTSERTRLICDVPNGVGCKSGTCSVQQESFGPVVHVPHMRSRAHDVRPRVCAPYYPSSEEVYEEKAPCSAPGFRAMREDSPAQEPSSQPENPFSHSFVGRFFQEVEDDTSSESGVPGKGSERDSRRESPHARIRSAHEPWSPSRELPPSQSQVPVPCFAAPSPEDVPPPALVVRVPGQQPRLYV